MLVFALSRERAQKPRAPSASNTVVPSIVSRTTITVFGFEGGGSYGAATTRGRSDSVLIGTAIRGGCSGSVKSSSISAGGRGTEFLRIIVTSAGSSSSGKSISWLGIRIKFGSSSSTSGVPSFIQNRRISSS